MKTVEKVYCRECGRLVSKKGFCDRCKKGIAKNQGTGK